MTLRLPIETASEVRQGVDTDGQCHVMYSHVATLLTRQYRQIHKRYMIEYIVQSCRDSLCSYVAALSLSCVKLSLMPRHDYISCHDMTLVLCKVIHNAIMSQQCHQVV